jgi:hypothetical protein
MRSLLPVIFPKKDRTRRRRISAITPNLERNATVIKRKTKNRIVHIHSFDRLILIDKSSRWSPSKALKYFVVFGHVITFAAAALVVMVFGDGCSVEEFVHARNRDDLHACLVLVGCCSCFRCVGLAQDERRQG